MPQVSVNSSNITTFRFALSFDLYNRKMVMTDLSQYSGSSGSGVFNILGISVSIVDQVGVEIATINFSDASKYFVPSVTNQMEIDLSSLPYTFLFQQYTIIGAIKDSTGTTYETLPVYKKVCEPVGITDGGYVPGLFQITPNCPDNVITVKELTLFTYNNQTPVSKSKTGTLSYPTGTISAVSFTGTPFDNNVIYTGQYRINCTTIAEYDLEDDVNVLVTYLTNNVFNVTCANKIADLICCMVDLQTTYLKNCNNAKGKFAQEQLNNVTIPFMLGLTKEINGQDASVEADLIRKTLNCDCGASSVRQNEFTPVNPASTSIVIAGVGGTTVPAPTVNGNTKTYNIASNVYQVVKGNTGDLAFTIEVDTSTSYIVKYKITFNYTVLATTILNTIAADATLVNLFNSIVANNSGGSNLVVDGKCIFSSSTTYGYSFVLSGIPATTTYALLTNILTSPITPSINFSFNLTNLAALQTYLNTLGLGTYVVVNSGGGVVTITSAANTHDISALTYSIGSSNFIATMTKSSTGFTPLTVSQVVQNIINYLCGLTTLQVALARNLTLWQIDYNGNPLSVGFTVGQSQQVFNEGIQDSIYNIVQRISLLTGVTCEKVAALFSDNPNISFTGASRLYGKDGASCVSWTDKQIALGIINAINSYSDVKQLFCAISCTDPATCPNPASINMAVVSGNIGIYGVTWDQNPIASQVASVYYKLSTDTNYTVATNNLTLAPNGNIQGTSPYLILGAVAGSTYDIKIVNNCGGIGFVSQIIIPTGTVYSGIYRRDNVLYLICGNPTNTYYTLAPFGVGVTVYTNIGATTPLTGFNYIADSAGNIYTIDPSTGVVLTITGSTCTSGTEGLYILGNSTGSICVAYSEYSLFTNGVFGTGGTLYIDMALTLPVTGYSYVVNRANNHIYNLNSVTGVIGSDTSLTCGVYSGSFKRSNSTGTICAAIASTLYSSAPFAPGVTMYTDAGLTTLATGFQFIATPGGSVYNMNTVTAVVGTITGSFCP